MILSLTHADILTFCQAMNWSLRMAFRILGRLWFTCTRHLQSDREGNKTSHWKCQDDIS